MPATQDLIVFKDGKPLLEVRPDARGAHVVSLGERNWVIAWGFRSVEDAITYAQKLAVMPPVW